MFVKTLFLKIFTFTLLISIVSSQATKPKTKSKPVLSCNYPLLNSLRLTGKQPGQPPVSMDSCQIKAEDNCCSDIDEIKILKSWDSFSRPRMDYHEKQITNSFEGIYNLLPHLGALNETKIGYHNEKVHWVKRKETQCYNSMYFYQQTNYDLIKGHKKTEEVIIDEIVASLSREMINVNPFVFPETNLASILKEFLSETNFGVRLINAFNSNYLESYVNEFGEKLSEYLTKLPPGKVALPLLEKNVKLEQYLNTTYTLTLLFKPIVEDASKKYFTQSIQSKASYIHVESLIKMTNELLDRVFKAKLSSNVNRNSLRKNILNNLINDEVLKRYIGSFLIPNDVNSSQTIFKYAEEKIYKLISDTIIASAALKKSQPTVILGRLLEQITSNSGFLQNLLNGGYCKIMTSVGAHLQLNANLNLFIGPKFTGKPHHFYSEVVRLLYTVPMVFAPYQNLQNNPIYNCDLRQTVPDLITRTLQDINTQHKWDVNLAYNRNGIGELARTEFQALNRKVITYSEMNEDTEKLCLKTEKHSLVRESSFDKKKFAHCGKTIYNFRKNFMFASIYKVKENSKFLLEIMKIKNGLFCAACSASWSQQISVVENKVTFSNKFCFDFVKKFGPYLKWRSEEFAKLMNQVYQFASCFDSDKSETVYPYSDKDKMVPKQIPGLENCLKIKSSEDITACLPICSDIKIGGFSELIEGDYKKMGKVFGYLVDVLRKNGLRYGNSTLEKADFSMGANVIQSGFRTELEKSMFKTDESIFQLINDIEGADAPKIVAPVILPQAPVQQPAMIIPTPTSIITPTPTLTPPRLPTSTPLQIQSPVIQTTLTNSNYNSYVPPVQTYQPPSTFVPNIQIEINSTTNSTKTNSTKTNSTSNSTGTDSTGTNSTGTNSTGTNSTGNNSTGTNSTSNSTGTNSISEPPKKTTKKTSKKSSTPITTKKSAISKPKLKKRNLVQNIKPKKFENQHTKKTNTKKKTKSQNLKFRKLKSEKSKNFKTKFNKIVREKKNLKSQKLKVKNYKMTAKKNQKLNTRKLKSKSHQSIKTKTTTTKLNNELIKTIEELRQKLKKKNRPRILSEEDSPILLFNGSLEDSDDRSLQQTPPATAKPATSGSKKKADKAPAAEQFTGNANVKLYIYLLKNIDNLGTTTRDDTANHDEIETAKVNYISLPPSKNLKNMKPEFKEEGLNLFEISKTTNLDILNVEKVVQKGVAVKSESLSPISLKEVVQIDTEDITMFQFDLDLEFSEVLPEASIVVSFPKNSDTDFANGPPKPNKNQTSTARKLKLQKSGDADDLKPIKRNREESLFSMMYKMMF